LGKGALLMFPTTLNRNLQSLDANRPVKKENHSTQEVFTMPW
jgi:hypothetical protein